MPKREQLIQIVAISRFSKISLIDESFDIIVDMIEACNELSERLKKDD